MRAIGVFLLFTMMAAWVLGQTPEPTSFELYSLPFADVDSTAQSVRSLVGEGGSVVEDKPNRRLLVVTTVEKHKQLAAIIGKLNVPPKNVRIQVEFRGASREQAQGFGVGGEGEVVRSEGLTRTSIKIQPRIQNQTVSISSRVSQSLLVASGREGLIHIGERVPYIEWIEDWGLRSGYFQQKINWQRVGSGMVVEPLVMGDGPMIRVRLTPELSGLVDGHPYRVRFARVSTEVMVANGQAFQIGSLDKDSEFYSRFLVGADNAGIQQTLQIFLTPQIMDSAAP